ncbi:MAG: lysophospholipid acyltransferase family protein [Deltaproteobacteria bacterium]|nr:lysophospholipid acyltransferase family protein [Deltaproteobacteria bacterium]
MQGTSLANTSLRLAGWQFETGVPTVKKFVGLAVPHTSNWDGLLLIALTRSIGLKMRWMIKDAWVKGPLSAPMRSLGAVAINRSHATNVVDQMVALFAKEEELALFIPPEGTRSRAETWKSGFYHIARGANVPVVPGYLDFARKRAGLGPPITMTGDVSADMDKIRAFYAEKSPTPFDPSQFGPIRLREELAANVGAK